MVAVATFVFEAIVGAERAFATPGFYLFMSRNDGEKMRALPGMSCIWEVVSVREDDRMI